MTTFRLPDFLNDPTLNGLRFAMGAPLLPRPARTEPIHLTPGDLRALEDEGLDVDPSEVVHEPDGTLSYKGKRVILYIRDVSSMGGRLSLPRYHVAHCEQLVTMARISRFKRYVLATREDGVFQINVVAENRSSPESLDVCQKCLDRLSWKDFTFRKTSSWRFAMVASFKLSEFFKAYPKDIISVVPDHNADTAPINDYPVNWGDISESLKKSRGLSCERCRRDMTGHARHFHAHHLNGQKNDCAPHNLQLLCLCCHADEPMHAHMKSLSSFKSFCSA